LDGRGRREKSVIL